MIYWFSKPTSQSLDDIYIPVLVHSFLKMEMSRIQFEVIFSTSLHYINLQTWSHLVKPIVKFSSFQTSIFLIFVIQSPNISFWTNFHLAHCWSSHMYATISHWNNSFYYFWLISHQFKYCWGFIYIYIVSITHKIIVVVTYVSLACSWN